MRKFRLVFASLLIAVMFISCQPRFIFYPIPEFGKDTGEELGFEGGGSGTVADPIIIGNAEEFARFASLAGSGNSKYSSLSFKLDSEITLTEAVAPITSYSGTFDGNGHAIKGYRNSGYAKPGEEADDDMFVALFASLDGGTVKNLTVEDYSVSFPDGIGDTNRYVSVVVGELINGGHVENVTVGEGTVVSPVRAGGIVGKIGAGTSSKQNVISNSYNYADVSTERLGSAGDTYGTAGGIASNITGSSYAVIEGCENYGDISGFSGGGIVGYSMSPDSHISGSYNHGTVSGTVFAGGVIGSFWYGGGGSIVDCHNAKDAVITSVQSYSGANDGMYGDINIGGIAGVVGLSAPLTVEDSTNEGTLKNASENMWASIGGIAGTASNASFTGCTSSGTIENAARTVADKNRNKWTVGGIAGWAKGINLSFKDSYGTDTVSGNDDGYYVYGSIAGDLNTQGESGTVSIAFTSDIKVERPFGYVHSSAKKGTAEFSINGCDFGSFDVALVNGFHMIIDLKNTSDIDNVRQYMILDDGDSDYGKMTLKNGMVTNVQIYPDADLDNRTGYPTWNDWENSLLVEGIDGFSWSFPPQGNTGNRCYFSINGTRVEAKTGTWSADGRIVNNE